jgi:hypothetical protein
MSKFSDFSPVFCNKSHIFISYCCNLQSNHSSKCNLKKMRYDRKILAPEYSKPSHFEINFSSEFSREGIALKCFW